MKHILQNTNIFLEINSFWAEINRLLFKNKEIIYQKQEWFWQRQSPVLFPIVGVLKDGFYYVREKKYSLSQHGFARDMEFECEFQGGEKISFILKSHEKTFEKYPYDFALRISYILEKSTVKIEYTVINTGKERIYFSLGAHPAFIIWADIDKYLLVFEKNMEQQKVDRLDWGLISWEIQEKFPGKKNLLPLSEDLFKNDAMIFRDILSKKVELYKEQEKIVAVSFDDFSDLGIWKQKNAPFLCIEPWCGFADEKETNQDFTKKAGIRECEPNCEKTYSWKIEF